MTKEEANKIIAEYMYGIFYHKSRKSDNGTYWYQKENDSFWYPFTDVGKYHASLDALVPVWKKATIEPQFIYANCDKEWTCDMYNGKPFIKVRDEFIIQGRGETIQEAAAIATATYIKEFIEE